MGISLRLCNSMDEAKTLVCPHVMTTAMPLTSTLTSVTLLMRTYTTLFPFSARALTSLWRLHQRRRHEVGRANV